MTKSIGLTAARAQCQGAYDAVQKEWDKIEKHHALEVENPIEWSTIQQTDPEATIVDTAMLLGLKNSELPESEQVWKARFIGLGNNHRDAFGSKVQPGEAYMHMCNFVYIRIAIIYSMLVKGICMRADLEAAY